MTYRAWRNAVLKRDGFRCVECGSTYRLCTHHIKPQAAFPELQFDVDNGKTLCFECHIQAHPENDTWMRSLHPASPETYQRMAQARLGKKATEETRRKLRESHLGHIPWNKDKHGIYSEGTRSLMGAATKGKSWSPRRRAAGSHPAWNKGMRISDEERRERRKATCRRYSEKRKLRKSNAKFEVVQ